MDRSPTTVWTVTRRKRRKCRCYIGPGRYASSIAGNSAANPHIATDPLLPDTARSRLLSRDYRADLIRKDSADSAEQTARAIFGSVAGKTVRDTFVCPTFVSRTLVSPPTNRFLSCRGGFDILSTMQTIRSVGENFPIDLHFFSSASRPTERPRAKSAPATRQAEAKNRATLVGVVICVVATIASLAPFANKAFHIDDTVFLCAARQICVHPADPFGCKFNWYGTSQELSEVVTNPPLASYYAALVASCFGWRETALHLAFLVPAVAAVLGTYFLAVRFCAEPLLAALATLLCPVFLISSTTLMCDVMMLAFMVWAVVLWLRSADGGSHVPAILSACLVAAASVTKYFAVISLVPLLLAYSLLRWPRVGWRVLYLAIPIAAFLGYDWAMQSLYGHSPLYGVGSYSLAAPERRGFLLRGVVTLSYAGGCLATVIFYAPMLWSRRVLAVAVLGIGLMVGAFRSPEVSGKSNCQATSRYASWLCYSSAFLSSPESAFWRLPSWTFGDQGTPNRPCWSFGCWEPLSSVGCSIGRSTDGRSCRWLPRQAS